MKKKIKHRCVPSPISEFEKWQGKSFRNRIDLK